MRAHLTAHAPATYRIRIGGHLDASWCADFGAIDVQPEDHPDAGRVTTLTGQLPDQAALMGLLARVYDLGLPLLLVEYLAPAQAPVDAAGPLTPAPDNGGVTV